MSDPVQRFDWHDAMVLYALISAGDSGASITGIASFSDYVNHAVSTEEEIRSSLNRLESAGHICPFGGFYKASAAAVRACSIKISGLSYIRDAIKEVERFLEGRFPESDTGVPHTKT